MYEAGKAISQRSVSNIVLPDIFICQGFSDRGKRACAILCRTASQGRVIIRWIITSVLLGLRLDASDPCERSSWVCQPCLLRSG